MKRLSFSILFTLISALYCYSQSVLSNNNYGGTNLDEGRSVIQLSNNRFLIGAFSQSNNHDRFGHHIGPNPGTSDIWIYEVDSMLQIQAQKTFGGTFDDRIAAISRSSSNSFFILGTTNSNDSDVTGNHSILDDIWVARVDSNYSILWQRCIGGGNSDEGTNLCVTSDGGCIISATVECCGYDVSNFHGGYTDGYVCKLDSTGQIQWKKTMGGTDDDQCTDIVQCADGSYLALGITRSINGDITTSYGDEDSFVFKINANGGTVWKRFYGGSSGDDASKIISTPDGGFIFVGGSGSTDGDVSGSNGGGDAWIVKCDSLGNIQWHKCIGGPFQEWAQTISSTRDSGYIISGVSTVDGGVVVNTHGGMDYFLIKMDGAGNYQWSNSYGGYSFDQPYQTIELDDNSFLSVGYSFGTGGDVTNNYGDRDIWIVRTAPLQVGTFDLPSKNNGISAHLNQSSLEINYSKLESQSAILKLYSLTGQLLVNEKIVLTFGTNQFQLPVAVTDGLYFLELEGLQWRVGVVVSRFTER